MKIKETTDIIAEMLYRAGVRQVIVSSGSRSLRMVRAVADNEGLTVRMVVDERVAAFMALGMGDSTRQPVALVCTSGTAMLNYAPAVAEAYYRGMPLIVITADRPIESIGINDGQTIAQYQALDSIVKASIDVDATTPCQPGDIEKISKLLSESLTPRQGPVHINLHLEEGGDALTYRSELCGIRDIKPGRLPNQVQIELSELTGKKILIFIGQRHRDEEFTELVSQIARRKDVVVIADIVANCVAGNVIADVESIIGHVACCSEEFKPDIVVTMGKTSPISRRFKEWLRGIDGYKHWRVNDKSEPEDTYFHLERTIVSDDKAFLRYLIDNMAEPKEMGYSEKWNELYKRAIKAKAMLLADVPWSDISAIKMVMDNVPNMYNIQCSNGMSIRYLSMIGMGECPIYCNRGVNGIDGSTSTALGFANVAEASTLLVTGDMSAMYDISALFSGQLTSKFKMVIIANKGGEIFRMIKATCEYEQRERLLCQIPAVRWRDVACAVGMAFYEASDADGLGAVLPQFFELSERASMLVVNTPSGNSRVYKEIINKIETKI